MFGFMYVVGELLEDQLLQKIVCLFIYVLRDRLLLHLLNSFHIDIFLVMLDQAVLLLYRNVLATKIKVMNVVSKCQRKQYSVISVIDILYKFVLFRDRPTRDFVFDNRVVRRYNGKIN